MWRSAWSLIPTLILLWPRQVHAANFTFTYGTATQCDDFSVSWTGGTPPFQLTLALSYGSYRTLDIPADNYSNGKGSFSATLPFPAAKQFMAIMSDSTGFATGGVSKLITVGKPSGQNSCNTTDPGVDFTFEANSFLGQCLTYTFDHYDGAVQPFTVTGIIPGGTVFPLTAPVGSTSFDWVVNVKSGTPIVFMGSDSKGRNGGCGQVLTVGLSSDATCLTKDSPAAVAHPPTQTKPATSKPSASKTQSASTTSATASATAAPDDGSSSKTNGATIAGAIIGCIIGAFVVGTLIWFYLRRRRGTAPLTTGKVGGFFGKFQKKEIDLMHDPGLPPPAAVSPYPLYHPQGGSHADVSTPNSTVNLLGNGAGAGEAARMDPYRAPASAYAPSYAPSTAMFAQGAPPSATGSQFSAFPPPAPFADNRGSFYRDGSVASWEQDGSVSSAMRRKAAAAGVSPYAPSTRFILHTDLEDDLPPPPPEDEVIELPPQYTERRAPPPPLAATSSPGASGSGSGSGGGYGQPSSSELPPPPSPSLSTASPGGLAYLSDRNSFAPSEHSIPSHPATRPS
ncbi:hypothetical protein PYCCODRAFT_1467041 [Trametes coccinea BRFM310]|uniref:Mid2 domain-containing protein n=1 Tax=Trametes coccinea (strain BRFM310) TaxID=1353009 RepID=A0A1Y2IPW1_TRAC3|nr:hypothetical protein PYCCODRAFT_1467041 [Trametes coccinea BRFM310]